MTNGDQDVAPYSPLITIGGQEYFPPPYSKPTLSANHRHSIIPFATLATISVGSCIIVIAVILLRMVRWRGHYKTWLGYNQYVVLALNLLIADLQQSSAFLVSWHWYRINAILAPSTPCFAQAWLLHSGDMSSGFFVLAIAVHTYFTAVHGKRLSDRTFMAMIAGVWIWSYFLTAIGIWIRGRDKYFSAAGSWCWVSTNFEAERLWCHYIWIFIIQFVTIILYMGTFFSLRKKTKELMSDGETPPYGLTAATVRAVNRIARLMMLYPFVYIVLTLPLSAGRMWTMAHDSRPTSHAYSAMAGSLLTSCGWIDALLYTLTRRRLLRDTMPGTSYGTANSAREPKEGAQGRNVGITDESSAMDLTPLTPDAARGDSLFVTGQNRSAFSPRSTQRDSMDDMLTGHSVRRGWSWKPKRLKTDSQELETDGEVLTPPPAYMDTRASRNY
ncbi:hypothetical protein CKM354_000220600 [Cercospora kikuchii]|uniref:G-protein coupled receptors family 1 profile domain-containing protein n=1 Tax=Cercospora kikuchii TaxID=84275 RepID=A0A9P3FDR0_9PEZI|nr:uncharacterized protein CKM354_000220600 [Cercospora kikuchii]GIZ38805.1 hypothetical protein CKM354_000220600 [Cercospora kikuchii]